MSPRGVTERVRTHTKKGNVRPFYLAEIQLDGFTVRVNNSYKNVSWNGETWNGVGDAGGISGVKEGSDLAATGVTLMLTGIDSDYWNEAMTANFSGRPCIIYAAFFDDDGSILADPIIIFEGACDQMNLATGNVGTVELTVETDMLRWRIPKEHRWTNADQQNRFPADKGFEFVSQVVEKQIIWGKGEEAIQQPQPAPDYDPVMEEILGGSEPTPYDPETDVGAGP